MTNSCPTNGRVGDFLRSFELYSLFVTEFIHRGGAENAEEIQESLCALRG